MLLKLVDGVSSRTNADGTVDYRYHRYTIPNWCFSWWFNQRCQWDIQLADSLCEATLGAEIYCFLLLPSHHLKMRSNLPVTSTYTHLPSNQKNTNHLEHATSQESTAPSLNSQPAPPSKTYTLLTTTFSAS